MLAELLETEAAGRTVGPGENETAFTVDVGSLSTYTHLWRYESYDERAERRARLGADPRWQAFVPKIQPLIHTQENRILVPTPFSPLR